MSYSTTIRVMASVLIIVLLLVASAALVSIPIRSLMDTTPRPEKPPETTCRPGYVKVYIDPDRPGAKRSICIPGYQP